MFTQLAPLTIGLALASTAAAQSIRLGEPRLMLPPDSEDSRDVVLFDVDGDGDLDLLLATQIATRRYGNDGHGVFTGSPAISDVVSSTSIGVGDVDGDALPDLVVGRDGPQNEVFLGDGAGGFTAAPGALPAQSDLTWEVLLADLDRDGDRDVITLSWGANGSMFHNDGTGQFVNQSQHLPDFTGTTLSADLGDVDGDGDPDVLIAVLGGQNRLYRNDGAGQFSNVSIGSLPPGSDNATDVELVDLDGDGDLDAISACQFLDSGVSLNDGTGSFTALPGAIQLSGNLNYLPCSDTGDLDADGSADLILGDQYDTWSLRGLGTGAFATPERVGATGTDVDLGDVDGDGDLDLVRGGLQLNGVHLNDGFGTLVSAEPPIVELFYDSRRLLAGDADGDGDPDLVHVDSVASQLWLGDGEGRFQEVPDAFGAGIPPARTALLRDLDGDGDADVVLGRSSAPYTNSLLRNAGDGTFVDASAALPADADATYSFAADDVDGDGDVDLVVGNSGPNRLYLNDGSGGFQTAPDDLPDISLTPFRTELCDVDGDGDVDLVHGMSSTDRIDLNSGTGVFTPSPGSLPPDSSSTRDLGVADTDADGDLDLVFANLGTESVYLINDGSGVYQAAPGGLEGNAWADALVLADLDENGTPDLFLARSYNQNLFYRNDGFGGLESAVDELAIDLDNARVTAAADFDRDGDLDVVIGTGSGRHAVLLRNRTRELYAVALPRLGTPLQLGVRGPGGEPWFLALSPGSFAFPLPPYGLLELAPAGLLVESSGVLDADGGAIRTLAVPSNPTLVGRTVYWQAVVGLSPRFTNLESTTVTDL